MLMYRNKHWTNFVLLILFGLLLSNCTPSQRLARILRNNPELIKTETIYKHDTTIVNGVTTDTIFKNSITKDTVVIKEKQLTIKYYNDGKTTYIKGTCDTVFVVKEIPVTIHSVQPPPSLTWWQRIKQGILYIGLGIPVGAFLLALVVYLIRGIK